MTSQTADQIAAKWAQNLSGATASITAGVQGVSTAPGQAAARNKAQYLAGVQAKVDKWAQNTAAVSLSEWQQAFITKGIPRIASGASAAQPKMTTFMAKLLPYQKAGVSQLPQRGNLQQNIQRATAWINYMANFSK